MKPFIWKMSLVFLIVALLPQRTHSDYTDIQLAKPSMVTVPPVELISVPTAIPIENIQYYLMVVDAFKDAPIMVDIATAEDRQFDPHVKNPSPKSTATGLFQITGTTWRNNKCEGVVTNATDNIACARKLYNRNGTSDWNESKGTWGKYL